MDEFITLFVNHVLARICVVDGRYSCWALTDNGVEVDAGDWDGVFYDGPNEFMLGMRDVIKEFTNTFPNKTQLKTMIVNFT